MVWIRSIHVAITGEILPKDVASCEALNSRHNEYKREIQAHEGQKNSFVQNGQKMIQNGNALSAEIAKKIEIIEKSFQQLEQIWHKRQILYDQNMDIQQFFTNATFLEQWLAEREQYLRKDWHLIESVNGVESVIRQYEDFLATLDGANLILH